MNFFRKLFLTIAIAFVVLCYGYPMFILPFGSYNYEYKVADTKHTVTLTFKFDGSYKMAEGETVIDGGYYKLKGNKIYLNDEKNFDDVSELDSMTINNMYNVKSSFTIGGVEFAAREFQNKVGVYIAIGVGVLSLLMVLSFPNRRRD